MTGEELQVNKTNQNFLKNNIVQDGMIISNEILNEVNILVDDLKLKGEKLRVIKRIVIEKFGVETID